MFRALECFVASPVIESSEASVNIVDSGEVDGGGINWLKNFFLKMI